MVKTKSQRAMTILIFAALAVAVGCGDGKRNMRGKVDKTADPNAKAAKSSAVGGGTNAAPGKAGATPAATGGVAAGSDKASNKATDDKIISIYNAYIAGSKVDLQSLTAGTYELEGSLTTFTLGPNTGYLVRGIQTFSLAEQHLNATDPAAYYGKVSNDADGGRNIQIPFTFTLSGSAYKIEKAKGDWLYMTKIIQDGDAPKLKDSVSTLTAGKITGSLADLLAGKKMDDAGKSVGLDIVKVDAEHVRFVMTFNEIPASTADNAIENYRVIVLTYKLTKQKEASAGSSGAELPAEGVEI